MQILSHLDLTLTGHERLIFEALYRDIMLDVRPSNTIQIEFAHALIRAAWTLRRCDAAERALAEELGIDPLLADDKRLDRIHRTRLQANREYRMALAELRRLQTDQAIRNCPQHEGLRHLPVPIETKHVIQTARVAGGYRRNEPINFAAPATTRRKPANTAAGPQHQTRGNAVPRAPRL